MTACTVDDVQAALDVLRAGVPGMNPEIDADTAGLWHYGVNRFTGPVVVVAATSWIQHQDRFPSLNQFIAACQSSARQLAIADEEAGVRGSVRCAECDGTRWVEIDETGRGKVRPCSRCLTDQWERWRRRTGD